MSPSRALETTAPLHARAPPIKRRAAARSRPAATRARAPLATYQDCAPGYPARPHSRLARLCEASDGLTTRARCGHVMCAIAVMKHVGYSDATNTSTLPRATCDCCVTASTSCWTAQQPVGFLIDYWRTRTATTVSADVLMSYVGESRSLRFVFLSPPCL